MTIRFFLGVVFLLGGVSSLSTLAQTFVTPTSPELVSALRAGGLPAAAKLVGNYKALQDIQSRVLVGDLTALAMHSDVVVRARVILVGASNLSSDSRWISTEYEFEVLERFQGLIPEGASVRVTMPGGRIQFANGATAEVWERSMPAMTVNLEKVLFLAALAGEPEVFHLVAGNQSIFGFNRNGQTISQARPSDEVFRRYSGLERTQFLAAVRASSGP